MAYSLGKAYIEVVPARTKDFSKTIESGVAGAETKASKGFGGKLWKGLKVSAAGAGLAVGGVLATSVTKGFGRLSAIETAESKLKGLGHSGKEVSTIMDDALKSVKGTAYGLDEAATLSGTLVASGIKPGKELQKTLSLTADSATIAGRSLDDMGLIWGSVAAKGKLQGDDAMQLLSSGIPIWQMVGKVMGKTAGEAQALGSKGQVSFDIFQKAMEQGVGGAAQESGKTTEGAFKNMNAALGRFGASLLKGVFPLIAPAFKGLTGWIDKANDAVGPMVENFTNGVKGIYDVLAKGDFTGRKNMFGLEEDSAAVGFLFTLRDAGVALYEKALKPIGQFMADNIVPIFAALGAGLATWGIQSAIASITAAVVAFIPEGMTLVGAIGAAVAAINWIPLAIGAAVAALVWFFTQTELGRDLIAKAFEGIKTAVGVVADFFTAKVWPALLSGWDILKSVVSAVWSGVLLPVITAIGSLVEQIFVGVVIPAFKQLVGFIQQTVWPIIQKLWTDYIQPIFTLIGGIVVWLWKNAIKPYFGLVAAFISNVLGPVVVWLWKNVISPAFSAIGAVIGFVFNNVVFPLLDLFKALLVNVIAPAAVWLWKNVMVPVWNGIKAAISAVAGWVAGTLVPVLQAAWKGIATAAMWLWKNVISPVWTGIKVAIAVAIAIATVYIKAWIALFKNVVAPVFVWLYKTIIKPVWNAIKTAISAVVGWFRDTAWPIFKKVIGYIHGRFLVLRLKLLEIWGAIKKNIIAPVVAWFRDTVAPLFEKVIGYIKGRFIIFHRKLREIWGAIKAKVIGPVVAWFRDTVKPIIDKVVGKIKSAFQSMRDKIGAVWSAIKNKVVKPVVDWFANTIKPKIDTFTDNLKSAFTGLKDSVVKTWKKIKDAVKKPINGVIDIYNKHVKTPFNTVINTILGGGSKAAKALQLPPMAGFATGGYTGAGSKYQPAGVVHADEYVIRKESQNGIERQAPGFLDALNTHGPRALTAMGYGYATGGRVLHGWKDIASIPHKGMAVTSTVRKGARTAGTGSVSKHATGYAVDFAGTAQAMKDFFNYVRANYKVSELIHTPMGGKQLSRGGIPKAHFPAKTAAMHYNHVHVGGYAPGEKQGAGTSGEAGTTNPFTGMWSKIKDTVAEKVGGGALGGMLSGLTHKVISNASSVVEKKIMEVAEDTGSWGATSGASVGTMKKYNEIATQALEMTGNFSKGNLKSLMRRMAQESSYNPNAVNKTDSNAAKGTPSKGLMQVIDPTFKAYAMPGYDKNIFDPLSNILASIRYTKARYGSLTKGWDRKGGYAAGGWTGPGSKYEPAGTVHADEFVVQKSSRRSIERERPGFLDRLNRHGAAALGGYANGGLVGYASGGKVSPLSKIGSTKVTVLLDGLTGTLKQVQTAAGKLADGIVKTFNDRMKSAKTATVNKLSDSLSGLKAEAAALKKTISATTSKSKKSAIAKLSDDLASLRKQKKTLSDTAREVRKVTKVTGTTKSGKKITKTVTVATSAAKKAAASLVNVNKKIETTQSALTRARRGDYSGAAKSAQARLKSVEKQIAATDKALKAARRGDYSSAALTKGTKAYNAYVAKGIKQLETYANKSDTLTSKLKAANTQLSEAKKLKSEYATSMTEKFQDTYGLSEDSGNLSVKTLIGDFKLAASKVTTFSGLLTKLRKKGLSAGLVDQIAQLGADSGTQVAKNILGGTDSQIKQLTSAYNKMNSVSKTSASSLAKSMYQTGVDTAQGLVNGLTAQLSKVTKASEKLANQIIKTVRKKLDIHSPSRVFRQIGVYTGQGMTEGIHKVTPEVQSAMARLATPPEAISGDVSVGANGGAASGNSINVNVQAAHGEDPSRIGRRVAESLNLYSLSAAL